MQPDSLKSVQFLAQPC